MQMRVITYQEIEELPRRLIAFLESLKNPTLPDESYDEMFETMKLYRNFHVQTDEMLPDRAIDLSTGIERVGEIMSRCNGFDETKWNESREKCDSVWFQGNIALEEEVMGLSALPFYDGHYVSSVFDPIFIGVAIHEVYPSRR